MEYYGFIVSSLNKPLYFVFGNHNLKRYNLFKKGNSSLQENIIEGMYSKSFGAIYLNGNCVRIKSKNLLIAGLGGSMKYNKGANQYSEFGMLMRILRMIPHLLWNKAFHGRYLDILLTHASPRGIHDREDPCHRGFRSFLWFMDKFQPGIFCTAYTSLFT